MAIVRAEALKILLVEDSDGDALALQRALKRTTVPMEIVRAKTAEIALGLFCQPMAQVYELLLVDLNLPGMSGLEMLSRIKAAAPARQTSVMIMSSSDRDIEIREAFSRGADNYYVKPMDFAGFDKLARYIEHCWCNAGAQLPADIADVILLEPRSVVLQS